MTNRHHTIESASKDIDLLREMFLFDTDFAEREALPPQAEQHFLVALSLLEQAKCTMKLADYCRMRNW